MKAQASSEFLVVLIALMLVYTSMVFMYSTWSLNLQQSKARLETLATANKVAFSMNFLELAGDGAQYSFAINAPNSNITIYRNILEAKGRTGASFSQFEMLTNSANATSIKNAGTVKIKNNGGKIEIS